MLKIGKRPVIIIPFLLWMACGDDGEHGAHSGNEVLDELCEHMAFGPSKEVLATTEEVGAPNVSAAHLRFDIMLAEAQPETWRGMVLFASGETSNLLVALSSDVATTVRDSSGDLVPQVSIETTNCSQIAKIVSFPVEIGPYTIEFGPTNTSEIRIVLEHAEAN